MEGGSSLYYNVVEEECSVASMRRTVRAVGPWPPHGVKDAARSGSSGAAPPNVVITGYASSLGCDKGVARWFQGPNRRALA